MARGESYQEFVDKFKPKKTTDDCYTPPAIYEVVKDWAVKEYKLGGKNIVRPFYPGMDYKSYDYKPGDVVIDNPPFSILASILDWYRERNIPFFLFAPGLTFFCHMKRGTLIVTNESVTYENGAIVNTGFITNMDTCAVRLSPTLAKGIREANTLNRKGNPPKYIYPDNVMTYGVCSRCLVWGELVWGEKDYKIPREEAVLICRLDSQRPRKKSIYGSGALVSDRVARDLKAMAKKRTIKEAEVKEWELSEREESIVDKLNQAY